MLYHVTCFIDTEVEADNEDEALELAADLVYDEIGVEPYED